MQTANEQDGISKIEIPFFISYVVFLLYMIFSTTFFYASYAHILKWRYVLAFCACLLAIYEFLRNGLTVKTFFAFIVVMLFTYNTLRISKGLSQNAIAAVLLYTFCARNISFSKISRITMIVTSVALAFIVISSYIGIIPNYVFSEERNRESLGFLYVLYAPALLSNITFLWIYNKKNKMSIKGVAVFFLLNLFFFEKTDARLCFWQTVFLLVFGLLFRKHEQAMLRRKVLCGGMILSFVLSTCISYLLTIWYNPSVRWMDSLNKMIESRMAYGQQSLNQNGLSAFGMKGIQWIGHGLNMHGEKAEGIYSYVDCYYIQLAQRFGYLFLILILVFMTIACYRAYRNGDVYLLMIFVIIAVHSILDNLYMYLQYNTFWFAAGMLVLAGSRVPGMRQTCSIVENPVCREVEYRI